MKVTPLEIRQQQFPLRFRGLDPGEVDKFLELVASDMEELIRENTRLRDGLAKKDQELQRVQKGDDELKKALVTIQQIREEWVDRAEKQAEQVLRESELKAKQFHVEAERRVESLQHDLHELERQKHQLASQIRHILEEHLRLLEATTYEEGSLEDHQRPLIDAADSSKERGETPLSEHQRRET
jgi:cell division initiation protein